MDRKMNVTSVLCGAIFWAALSNPAYAYVGQDPVFTQPTQCHFVQATATLGLDGSVKYNVMGTCGGHAITGQMAYATNHQMSEKFIYRGAEIRSTAICQADPWVTGAVCEDQKVATKGANPGELVNYRVPLSLAGVGAREAFQNARANAAKPNPPGPPVNPKAITRGIDPQTTAIVTWLGPDERAPFGQYSNFIVEARPQNAQGAAWTKLGGTARHPAPNYQVAVKLPPTIRGTQGWELRACSTTVFASTCTAPFVPTPDLGIQQEVPGSTIKSVVPTNPNSILKNQSGTSASSIVTPKTPPLANQSVSPGQASSLNPQPLPPKVLSTPNSSRLTQPSILRRGVPQEEGGEATGKPGQTAPDP